jgi:hypothetical protein
MHERFGKMIKVWLLIGFMSIASLAEERDPMRMCDEQNSACNQKCDAMENASSECYNACDNAYQRCLDIANGYTPEPVQKPRPKKAPPPTAKPLKSQDKGKHPDASGGQ